MIFKQKYVVQINNGKVINTILQNQNEVEEMDFSRRWEK